LFSVHFNRSFVGIHQYFAIRLFLILAALPFPGWTFSAFAAGAVDQHLFKKPLSHAPAADILVILQSKVNNTPF
jgi:hypothetical protein